MTDPITQRHADQARFDRLAATTRAPRAARPRFYITTVELAIAGLLLLWPAVCLLTRLGWLPQ